MKRRRQLEEDRLSQLPDKTLERILSSLGTVEAVRTSALSRRWRTAYAAVPVVDLVDPKQGHMHCCSNANTACFDLQVTAAILGKSPGTPIRALRLDACRPPTGLLDQWVATAVTSGAEEIDVRLRYWHDEQGSLCPFGSSKGASADFDKDLTNMYTKTQRQVFRCGTLRRLRLTNWTLDLPTAGVVMSSLETLCLARIMDPGGLLQELLSSGCCPRLADLTLQECPSVREITVTSPRLRSFAMICCHHATRVELRSPCLQALHYKGALPGESFFKVANDESIMALTIEICEDTYKKERAEVIPVTTLISKCAKLTYLHLTLRPTMAYHSSLFADALRGLPCLRQLGLQGCLYDYYIVRSVAVLLRETCNLEVLSLFLSDPKERRRSPSHSSFGSDNEPEDDSDDDGVECGSQVTDTLWYNMWCMQIRCLDHKLRRISIEKYSGRQLERLLAKFLLSRAAALDKFSVTLTAQHSRHRNASELKSWRSNRHTRIAVDRWQEKL